MKADKFFEAMGHTDNKKEELIVQSPFIIVYASALLLAGCSSAEPTSSWGRQIKLNRSLKV